MHLHTSASADYEEPDVSYLDILRQAETRGLDIIAFTDHNPVAGCRAMAEEIRQLELLEQLGRLREDEAERLGEYRRLGEKVLVLPGFEFTATFGFHILGIFSPEVDVREAVLWAILSGAVITAVKILLTRRAANYYAKSTGQLPPGLTSSN